MCVLIKLILVKSHINKSFKASATNNISSFTWSAYPMLQSSRGPEMERTKFMQVMIEGASGLFQNLSSVATEMGKQAG